MLERGYLRAETGIGINAVGLERYGGRMSAKRNYLCGWLPASLVLILAVAAVAAAGPGYKVVNTYKVGGDGGWDYLTADAAARRLYISRATHVIVLDLDSGKSVGDIADTPGVHGIALAPELGRGFTSNGREGTVSIFDLKTLATSSKIKVGENPDATAFDDETGLAFASCGEGVLSVIHEDSAEKFSLAESVPTQAGARTLALDSKTHDVFVVTAKFGPPPAATADNPHPRRSIVPDSFVVLVLSK